MEVGRPRPFQKFRGWLSNCNRKKDLKLPGVHYQSQYGALLRAPTGHTMTALTVEVRGLFMRAFMSSSGKQGDDISLSLELYRRALSILEWGRETWKNVPDSVRGAIFSRTFVRGIRRFYLEAYFKVSESPYYSGVTST